MNSVSMHMQENLMVWKVGGVLKDATGIMKDMGRLIRLEEFAGLMEEMKGEMENLGMVEEVTSEMFDEIMAGVDEDEVVEEAVEAIIAEVTAGQLGEMGHAPTRRLVSVERERASAAAAAAAAAEEEEEEEAEMKRRLEALAS